MKDFKSYSQQNTPSNSQSGEMPDEIDGIKMDEMIKLISKTAQNKSPTQLFASIIAEAERGKREGRLTNADLDNFFLAVSPLVDGMKRKRLKDIVERLKAL